MQQYYPSQNEISIRKMATKLEYFHNYDIKNPDLRENVVGERDLTGRWVSIVNHLPPSASMADGKEGIDGGQGIT